MPASALLFLLSVPQVSVTAGVVRPPREVSSSRGQPGTPSDATVARVEAAFQQFKSRKLGVLYQDRYFWSDRQDSSLTRYLYFTTGDTVPGVHIVNDGEQPRVFDGGCRVISGELQSGGTPAFRCNNDY